MSESLFSGSWYRVAALKPRLRGHAAIHRHLYRGRVWYVLQDHSSGRFHRFSPVANLVIGLMDGRRTLQSIWETACTRLGDDAPTQDEVINVLATLHRADVLQTDAPPDIGELQERTERQAKQRIKQLERELRRKDAALAETAALLVLRKKAEALWGKDDQRSGSPRNPAVDRRSRGGGSPAGAGLCRTGSVVAQPLALAALPGGSASLDAACGTGQRAESARAPPCAGSRQPARVCQPVAASDRGAAGRSGHLAGFGVDLLPGAEGSRAAAFARP